MVRSALVLLAAASAATTVNGLFSVNDDILAFPQVSSLSEPPPPPSPLPTQVPLTRFRTSTRSNSRRSPSPPRKHPPSSRRRPPPPPPPTPPPPTTPQPPPSPMKRSGSTTGSTSAPFPLCRRHRPSTQPRRSSPALRRRRSLRGRLRAGGSCSAGLRESVCILCRDGGRTHIVITARLGSSTRRRRPLGTMRNGRRRRIQ